MLRICFVTLMVLWSCSEVFAAEGGSTPFIIVPEVWVYDDADNFVQSVRYGQSIVFNLTVGNTGSTGASGLTVSLNTNDPNITITDGDHDFGFLDANSEMYFTDVFGFDVADLIEDQHAVQFSFDFEDADGNTWSHPFSLVLNAPVLTVEGLFVYDIDENYNTRMESGETVTLFIDVANSGGANSSNAIGELTTTSPYLTIDNATSNIGSILSGESGSGIFTVTVDENTPESTLAELSFTLLAGDYGVTGGFSETINLIVEVWPSGVIEGSTFNWTTSGDADWYVIDQDPFEAPFYLRSGVIEDGQESKVSIELNFLEAGDVSFARRVSSELGFDFLQFFINGQEQDSWSGTTFWEQFSYPVTAGNHTLEWVYIKDENCCFEGEDAAYLDFITFPPFEQNVSVEEIQTANVRVFPNPTEDWVNIQFENQRTKGSVKLLDVQGRIVRSLPLNDFGNNVTSFSIQSLSTGLYTLQIETEASTLTKQIVKH